MPPAPRRSRMRYLPSTRSPICSATVSNDTIAHPKSGPKIGGYRMKRVFLVLGVLSFVTVAAIAQRAESVALRDAVGVKSYPAAPRLTLQTRVVPAVMLDSVARVMPER